MAGKKGASGTGRMVKPAKVRMTAAARATKIVDQLMGKAHAVLEEHLTQTQEVALIDPLTGQPELDENGRIKTKMIGGDPRVAMYVLDRAWPKKGTVLPSAIHADLSTIDGVIECARVATEMLLDQRMSLEDGRQLLDHLMRYCQLKAFERLDELKLLVEEFEKQNTGHMQGKLDPSMLPTWGRLTETSPVSNKEPAE